MIRLSSERTGAKASFGAIAPASLHPPPPGGRGQGLAGQDSGGKEKGGKLLGVIAHNLGNLLRRLVLPLAIQSWSLTSLQPRLFRPVVA
jgi:hypothetical protein